MPTGVTRTNRESITLFQLGPTPEQEELMQAVPLDLAEALSFQDATLGHSLQSPARKTTASAKDASFDAIHDLVAASPSTVEDMFAPTPTAVDDLATELASPLVQPIPQGQGHSSAKTRREGGVGVGG